MLLQYAEKSRSTSDFRKVSKSNRDSTQNTQKATLGIDCDLYFFITKATDICAVNDSDSTYNIVPSNLINDHVPLQIDSLSPEYLTEPLLNKLADSKKVLVNTRANTAPIRTDAGEQGNTGETDGERYDKGGRKAERRTRKADKKLSKELSKAADTELRNRRRGSTNLKSCTGGRIALSQI